MASIAFDIFARDRASATFDKLGRKVGETEGRFSKHAAAIGAGLATAGIALVGFAKTSIDAYTDAEKSQRVLTDAYQRFPALADIPLQALRDQAQALQSVTKFDGDATAAAMGQLAAFHLTGKQLQDLTPLMLDYAAKTGKDLPSAANTLGKALLGNGKGLKDVGIKFHDTGSASGNFAELMGGLRQQVGGFATTEGKSAEGRADILKNKFDDLKEAVGKRLLPVVTTLVDQGIKLMDWMAKNPGKAQALAVAFGVLAGAIALATGAQPLLNLAFLASAPGAVILAIAGLVAIFVVAYKKSQTFRDIVSLAFAAVKIAALGLALQAVIAFRFLLGVWLSVAAGIVHGAALAFGWVPGLGPKLREADAKVTGFKNSVNATLGKVQRKLEIQLGTAKAQLAAAALKYRLDQLKSKSLTVHVSYTESAFTGRVWDGTKWVNPGLRAAGGPIRRGHAYLVGEKGPELIYAQGNGQVMNASDTRAAMAGTAGRSAAGGVVNNYNISINGPTIGSPDIIARQIHQALLKYKDQGGPVSMGLA